MKKIFMEGYCIGCCVAVIASFLMNLIFPTPGIEIPMIITFSILFVLFTIIHVKRIKKENKKQNNKK